MKIYITRPNINNDEYSGSGYKVVQYDQLESVTDSSATEILCEDVLDYVENRFETLDKILRKLRHGGRIIIAGIELEDTARQLVTHVMDMDTIISLLYGGRHSTSSVYIMTNRLQQYGLSIMNARISNNKYYITASRNNANQNNM